MQAGSGASRETDLSAVDNRKRASDRELVNLKFQRLPGEERRYPTKYSSVRGRAEGTHSCGWPDAGICSRSEQKSPEGREGGLGSS